MAMGSFFLRRTHKYCSMVTSFFFLRRTHKYCSTVVGFFSFAIYTNTTRSVPFFSISPTAHLKSSPSDDESESETFIFHRFRGRVHDNSTFLHCPTLSKGRMRSAPDDASVEAEEEEEEEEEVDEEGLYSASSCDIWRSKALIKSGYLKIKIGYLTPAFLGARKWAEMLPTMSGACLGGFG